MTPRMQLGQQAENLAAAEMVRRGYRIVERNYRCFSGELDIVARDGDVLVFVEVRSRADPDHGHASEMVSRRKQRQVSRVAAHYLAARRPQFDEARFDVVAKTGDQLELIKDAWRA